MKSLQIYASRQNRQCREKQKFLTVLGSTQFMYHVEILRSHCAFITLVLHFLLLRPWFCFYNCYLASSASQGLLLVRLRTLIHDIDLDIQSDTVRSTFGPLQTSVSVRRNKYQFKIHPTCQLFCVLHIRSKTDHQANAPPHIAMDLCTGIFYIITYSTYKKISEIQSIKKTWLGFRFIMHLTIFSASVP